MTLNGISLTEPEGWVDMDETLDLTQELTEAYWETLYFNCYQILTGMCYFLMHESKQQTTIVSSLTYVTAQM